MTLSSFEPHIQGTRNLIDFARSASMVSSLKFLFTSSVASASSWDKSRGLYPEEIVLDARYAVGNGYGESKYVAERVRFLHFTCLHRLTFFLQILALSGLHTTSFRIGQITGGPNGSWATTDWVPILVKSSIALGALPSTHGQVSWLPMREVSQIILDVAFSFPSSQALNVVHPCPVPWSTMITFINTALVQEGVTKDALPVVDFPAWFNRLEDAALRVDPSTNFTEIVCSTASVDVFPTKQCYSPLSS